MVTFRIKKEEVINTKAPKLTPREKIEFEVLEMKLDEIFI